MDNPLERVLTVHQTAMAATRLPLELQQQVYSYLDTRSFYAARNVCKWWRFASLDAITLTRQLRKLPLLPLADARKSTPRELQSLWSEAAHTLMLGTRVQRQPDAPGSMSAVQQIGFQRGPRVTSTTNGARTVTINDRTIGLFDTSDGQSKVLAQRPLNDLKETIGSGPWLKMSPTSYHELALSSNGRLLAVAQERTIQIYDLLAGPDSFTANEYISSAAGHYICGLDFEQNDHVVRVRLSGKGAVLYLGTPPADHKSREPAGMVHWTSSAGLQHVFLDSTLLSLDPQNTTQDPVARLSGLQLLRPWQNGFLIAAQRHGGNESSHYVLAHVKCSIPSDRMPVLTVEPESVTVLNRLESFLSAWDYTLNGQNEAGMGLWENMPSAHEHHPSYALSPDGGMLVIAERDKKAIRPVPLTQLFLYRLPNDRRMMKTLSEAEQARNGRWATLSSFLDKLDTRAAHSHHDRKVAMADAPGAGKEQKHKVARLPLCLSTVRGVVSALTFDETVDETGARAFTFTASTIEALKSWKVSEV
ncbi:hypothetical protein LTR53_007031 [Teratosphaeriaceae sp. CCFEE 6253]|nr:hypothetical protein LTR53_007031 [Teratosphaeriaceae sp. CCFEE 6253]